MKFSTKVWSDCSNLSSHKSFSVDSIKFSTKHLPSSDRSPEPQRDTRSLAQWRWRCSRGQHGSPCRGLVSPAPPIWPRSRGRCQPTRSHWPRPSHWWMQRCLLSHLDTAPQSHRMSPGTQRISGPSPFGFSSAGCPWHWLQESWAQVGDLQPVGFALLSHSHVVHHPEATQHSAGSCRAAPPSHWKSHHHVCGGQALAPHCARHSNLLWDAKCHWSCPAWSRKSTSSHCPGGTCKWPRTGLLVAIQKNMRKNCKEPLGKIAYTGLGLHWNEIDLGYTGLGLHWAWATLEWDRLGLHWAWATLEWDRLGLHWAWATLGLGYTGMRQTWATLGLGYTGMR